MIVVLLAHGGLIPIPIGTDSWLVFAIVLVTLVIFIWLIARLTARVTGDTDPAETDRQMLTAITDLHRKGDLSLEEYRSIKSQLVRRLWDPGVAVQAESADAGGTANQQDKTQNSEDRVDGDAE